MYEALETLIKDLPEETKEQARKCRSIEELSMFLADNDIELPEDVLDQVSGGAGCDIHSKEPYCPYCDVMLIPTDKSYRVECSSCHKIITKYQMVWK